MRSPPGRRCVRAVRWATAAPRVCWWAACRFVPPRRLSHLTSPPPPPPHTPAIPAPRPPPAQKDVLKVQGTIGQHSFLQEEQGAFVEHINSVMGGDTFLREHGYVPIEREGDGLFRAMADGILLWCVGAGGVGKRSAARGGRTVRVVNVAVTLPFCPRAPPRSRRRPCLLQQADQLRRARHHRRARTELPGRRGRQGAEHVGEEGEPERGDQQRKVHWHSGRQHWRHGPHQLRHGAQGAWRDWGGRMGGWEG